LTRRRTVGDLRRKRPQAQDYQWEIRWPRGRCDTTRSSGSPTRRPAGSACPRNRAGADRIRRSAHGVRHARHLRV